MSRTERWVTMAFVAWLFLFLWAAGRAHSQRVVNLRRTIVWRARFLAGRRFELNLVALR